MSVVSAESHGSLNAWYPYPLPDAPSWRDEAACRGMTPEESERIFFPTDPRSGPERQRMYDEARSYCDGCPVVRECLQDALDWNDRDGFRGGMSASGRARLRAQGGRRVDRCEDCEEFFKVRRRGQRFCSQRCAGRSYMRRERVSQRKEFDA